MNEDLQNEWLAGEGQYAMIWLAEMVSRRLVDQIEDLWDEESELLACADNNHRAPLAHDIHIVRLAMVTEKRLVTLEKKLLKYLRVTVERAGKLSSLRLLHVASPVRAGIISWLDEGAPDEDALCLVPSLGI